MIKKLLRRVFRGYAYGGEVGPAQPSDVNRVKLSPGYVSLDGGQTWHSLDEYPLWTELNG